MPWVFYGEVSFLKDGKVYGLVYRWECIIAMGLKPIAMRVAG